MLLAADIGNTNINFGLFNGKRLRGKFSITTAKYNIKQLRKKISKTKIDDAIICSVVPSVSRVLSKDLKKIQGKAPYLLGSNIKIPVKNLYRKPKQVGDDRLVNAYAGIVLYGSPLILIDFGTAVTFEAVSKKGEYLGGMILPGVDISLNAMAERTVLLPKVKLQKPKELIGKDTKESMRSGMVYGYASLVDDLSNRIKEEIGMDARVVATGGSINLIAKYCRSISKVDQDLTLKGLNLIYCTIELSKNYSSK